MGFNTPQPAGTAHGEPLGGSGGERLPPTQEETLVYNLCVCEQQLKAAIDAAEEAGIYVDMAWPDASGLQLTYNCWRLKLSKPIHYPTEVTP